MFGGSGPTVEAPRRDIRSKRPFEAITPTPPAFAFTENIPPSKRTKIPNHEDLPRDEHQQIYPDSMLHQNAFDDYMHDIDGDNSDTMNARQKPGVRRTYDDMAAMETNDIMDVETHIEYPHTETMYGGDNSTASVSSDSRMRPIISSLSPEPLYGEITATSSKRSKPNISAPSTESVSDIYPPINIFSVEQAREMIAELLHQRQMREKQMRDRNRLVQELHDQLNNIQQVNAQMRQFYMGTVESLQQERQRSTEKDIVIRQLQHERDQCRNQLQQWAQMIRNYPQ